jgi:hypothetical protein
MGIDGAQICIEVKERTRRVPQVKAAELWIWRGMSRRGGVQFPALGDTGAFAKQCFCIPDFHP